MCLRLVQMEASYELLLHGVRVVEKRAGLLGIAGGGKKIMWIEEKEGQGSCVFVEEKRKRNRERQPTRGIPLGEIGEVKGVEGKPRRIRLAFQREVMDGEEVRVKVMKQKKQIDIRNKRAIEKREEEEGFGVGVFERMGIRGRKDS
ncbi:hypothetical protein TrRE_jg8507 [Triparma retinervis]|uniref:Uncharacterized protein n=1 Tax=Triparma retinervis TaxID=2557542 RepID=A0A9W7ALT7_9STRA|nr:hypothetical protein TrRE_jg8507 [Triparma retinervis]